jgi:hypothetical protein
MVKDKVNVDILGTEYTVERRKRDKDVKLDKFDGYCDETIKLIVVEDFQEDNESLNDLAHVEEKILRHEVIHAFLNESGLTVNSEWARNEEMVDYFAIQFPKMVKVMNSLTLLR